MSDDNVDAIVDSLTILIYRLISEERAAIIRLLSDTEFTSLEHMPHEAALLINERGFRTGDTA